MTLRTGNLELFHQGGDAHPAIGTHGLPQVAHVTGHGFHVGDVDLAAGGYAHATCDVEGFLDLLRVVHHLTGFGETVEVLDEVGAAAMLIAGRQHHLCIAQGRLHRGVNGVLVVVTNSGQRIQTSLHRVHHGQILLFLGDVERLLLEFLVFGGRQIQQLDAHVGLLEFRRLAETSLQATLDLRGGPQLAHALPHLRDLLRLLTFVFGSFPSSTHALLRSLTSVACRFLSGFFGGGSGFALCFLCGSRGGGSVLVGLGLLSGNRDGLLLQGDLLLDLRVLPLHLLDDGFERGTFSSSGVCGTLRLGSVSTPHLAGRVVEVATEVLLVGSRDVCVGTLLHLLFDGQQLGGHALAVSDDLLVGVALGGQRFQTGLDILLGSLFSDVRRSNVGAVEVDDRRHGRLQGRRQLVEFVGVFLNPLIRIQGRGFLDGGAKLLNALCRRCGVLAKLIEACDDAGQLRDHLFDRLIQQTEVLGKASKIVADSGNAFIEVGSNLRCTFQMLFKGFRTADGAINRRGKLRYV